MMSDLEYALNELNRYISAANGLENGWNGDTALLALIVAWVESALDIERIPRED